MLMKLTTGVDFINVLRAAFAHTDPKSPKKTDNLNVFFALLGSARTKAALRMLMKLALALSFADHQWFYFLKRQKGKKDEKVILAKKATIFGNEE